MKEEKGEIDFSDMTTVREYVCQKFEIYSQQILGYTTLRDSANIEFFMDDLAKRLCISIRAYILAGKHEREPISIEEPSSWLQHLKRDFAPAWLTKRWPVRTSVRTVIPNINVYVCPHSNVKFPDISHLKFMAYGED